MPNQTIPMGILEMDFERILGAPFFILVLTPSCCVSGSLTFLILQNLENKGQLNV